MTKRLPADEVPMLLRPGMTVYAPGLGGESALFTGALSRAAERGAGVRFVGVWLPGINRFDYAGLHPDARAEVVFVGRELAASFAAGRIDFRPLSYYQAYRWLERRPIDLALVRTSLPDESGRVSLGVANDFTPAILDRVLRIVAHVDPGMPPTTGAAGLPLASVDWVVEGEAPRLRDDDAPDPVFDAIGRHVASLIGDGDTLEVGVGRVQRVFAALTGARGLRLHTGAVTSPVLTLAAAGALADDPGAVTAGVAFGTDALYDWVAEDARVRFAPVGHTHDIRTLGAIERFVAVNSVIEVDLLGQANAEMIAGRQVGAAGGIVDFMRGARASPGGRAIVVLPSVAGNGASKIVAALSPGSAVSVARGDMDLVVTEHGVADLREGTIDDRARALIAIAAPDVRERLTRDWAERRRRM